MDRGLWAWTRHPNYFGDACVWWGLWLITITGWWSLPTVLSPLLMTYFLVYATGARLTEKYMAGRPGFDEYQATDIVFRPAPAPIGTTMTTVVCGEDRLPVHDRTAALSSDLDALLHRVARRDADAFAALLRPHQGAGVRAGDTRAAGLRLQRGNHPGGLPGGVADRARLRLGQGLRAVLADDDGAPTRHRPGARRAGRQRSGNRDTARPPSTRDATSSPNRRSPATSVAG